MLAPSFDGFDECAAKAASTTSNSNSHGLDKNLSCTWSLMFFQLTRSMTLLILDW